MSCVPLDIIKGIWKVPTSDKCQFVVECNDSVNGVFVFRTATAEQRDWWQVYQFV